MFPPERCIFRDEMAESVDADTFRERVWRMVSRRIGSGLTLPQIDRVCYFARLGGLHRNYSPPPRLLPSFE